jgi:hypothetical protein
MYVRAVAVVATLDHTVQCWLIPPLSLSSKDKRHGK